MCRCLLILIVAVLLVGNGSVSAQVASHAPQDTILLGGIVVDGDTLALVYLDNFEVVAPWPAALAARRRGGNNLPNTAGMDRLRHNVYKVYPYAVTAAEVLKDVDYYLDQMPDKASRKKYLKSLEADLNKRFKGELKNLTISQGQILVKLIDRQTGKSCFHIVKELKGGFNAFVWNGVAQLFSNNLKRTYDPTGADANIEAIVRELEARKR